MKSISFYWRVLAPAMVLAVNLDAQRITRRESHGEVHNRVDVSTVVAAIDDAARIAPRLARLTALAPRQIRVVDVRPFIAAATRSSYAAALARGAQDVEALRTALLVLDTAVNVLAAQRPALTLDDVVAAGILDVIETGESFNVLVLYIDRQNKVGTSPHAPSRTMEPLATFRPTTAALLAAVQTSPEMVARVSVINALRLDRVKFFDVDAIVKPAEVESYRNAVRQNETAIRQLRAELSKRPLVMHALARHDAKLMLGDIFAADILGNDDALVLYFKRPSTGQATAPHP